jgi:hypothetical protein
VNSQLGLHPFLAVNLDEMRLQLKKDQS